MDSRTTTFLLINTILILSIQGYGLGLNDKYKGLPSTCIPLGKYCWNCTTTLPACNGDPTYPFCVRGINDNSPGQICATGAYDDTYCSRTGEVISFADYSYDYYAEWLSQNQQQYSSCKSNQTIYNSTCCVNPCLTSNLFLPHTLSKLQPRFIQLHHSHQ